MYKYGDLCIAIAESMGFTIDWGAEEESFLWYDYHKRYPPDKVIGEAFNDVKKVC